jgi:hypothetical protein
MMQPHSRFWPLSEEARWAQRLTYVPLSGKDQPQLKTTASMSSGVSLLRGVIIWLMGRFSFLREIKDRGKLGLCRHVSRLMFSPAIQTGRSEFELALSRHDGCIGRTT